MSHVPARVGEAEARRFFTRPRLKNLYGLLEPRERTLPSGARLPRLECIWLGYYLVDLAVRLGKARSSQSVTVDGQTGYFALFALHAGLVDGEPPASFFAPAFDEETAIRTAREELLRHTLRRRSREGKPAIEETLGVRVIYYPYWVWYFPRSYGRIDVRIQDAYTGESGGNRIRAGIVHAIVANQRERGAG